MATGGYRIVSLRGIDVGGAKERLPGIYNELKSNITKPIMLRDFLVNGVSSPPAFVIPSLNGTDIDLLIKTAHQQFYFVQVENDDEVGLFVRNFG